MDIVERLKARYMDTKHMLPCALEHEAADEITRLRTEVAIKEHCIVQTEAEVERLRSDLALAQGQRDASEREIAECDALRSKLADILTRTANALKGEPGPLQSHSWHDLPERVTAAMNALAGAMELASANVQHDSDCAMHNAPAYPNGPCDCSVSISGVRVEVERLRDENAGLRAERDEADRRAGAAERMQEHDREAAYARDSWLRKAKEQWGVGNNVSFDVVWSEALSDKKDAARYRWLRIIGAERGVLDWSALGIPYKDIFAMDAAIDSAMQAMQEKSDGRKKTA